MSNDTTKKDTSPKPSSVSHNAEELTATELATVAGGATVAYSFECDKSSAIIVNPNEHK